MQSKWNKRWISRGAPGSPAWAEYTRGNCRITESPSGKVTLFSPGFTTEHTSVAAAKRAAESRPQKGWR